jgi:hypothetical protein
VQLQKSDSTVYCTGNERKAVGYVNTLFGRDVVRIAGHVR